MFGIIGWIIFGAIVGFLARLLHPGRDPGGFILTTLLGIAGSLLGGFIGRAAGIYHQGQGAGFLMSVVGAIILLVIWHVVAGRRTA
ncbi:MAG: GlsB/YeaQ/YmgE family stress response membrane protein [Acidobacteriia bacterium]|nr:GlsB/YeaQ/YmgE family stress response membrane protein [Terriglobia bacterium]